MSLLLFKSISFICVAGQMLLNRAQRFTYIIVQQEISSLHPLVFWFWEKVKRCSRDAFWTIVSSCRNGRYVKQARKECCYYTYQMLEDSERTHSHKSYTVHGRWFSSCSPLICWRFLGKNLKKGRTSVLIDKVIKSSGFNFQCQCILNTFRFWLFHLFEQAQRRNWDNWNT